MLKSKIYTVAFKRKRERKTNYKKRIKYISSNKIRIVIRLSNKNIKIQGIKFNEDGDLILGTIISSELKKLGWKGPINNIPSAYLIGFLFGKKFKDKFNEGIIDIGLKSITRGAKLSAAIMGIVDSGINIPHSKEIFPVEDKICGRTLSEFLKKLKETNQEVNNKQFSKYLKKGFNPEDLIKNFEEVKKRILGEKEVETKRNR